MADPKRPPSLPAMRDTRMPARGSVHLPADSGAWWGSPTTILKKNAAFVRAHADYLEARTTQARSGQGYVDACHELARSIARLDWLPEILEADYLRGKLDRAHDIEMQRIAHATAQAEARINLARTEHYLASLRRRASPPMRSRRLSRRSEASDELRRTISLLLKGRLREKQE